MLHLTHLSIISAIATLLTGLSGQVVDDFVRDLFSSYEKSVRPYCLQNDTVHPTDLTMDMSLRQLIELNEPRQMLKINVWIRMTWFDCRFAWNDTGFFALEHIMVPQNKVWVPDLTLYDNSAATTLPGLKSYVATIKKSGIMKYHFPSVINSMCAIDVRFFPFDFQTCKLEFGSWAYSGSDINISSLSDAIDMANYIENIEWSVLRTGAVRRDNYFGNESYPTVTYEISLRRKSLFYVMNMIFPCLLITFVAVLGFVLPPDSGEKVNLEVTVMLSLAVFQLIVLDLIPASGDSTPFIAIYFMMSMILVGSSCLMTVIVLQIHFRGSHGRRISPVVYNKIMIPLAKITCVKLKPDCLLKREKSVLTRKISVNMSKSRQTKPEVQVNTNLATEPASAYIAQSLPSEVAEALEEVSSHIQSLSATMCETDEEDIIKLQWSILAIIFDRLFLIIYLLSTICATMVLFMQFDSAY